MSKYILGTFLLLLARSRWQKSWVRFVMPAHLPALFYFCVHNWEKLQFSVYVHEHTQYVWVEHLIIYPFVCIQGRQLQDFSRRVDQEEIWRLQELVKTQSQQIEALSREIGLLSRKGGHVLPTGQAPLPPLIPLSTPDYTHTVKPGPGTSLQTASSTEVTQQAGS